MGCVQGLRGSCDSKTVLCEDLQNYVDSQWGNFELFGFICINGSSLENSSFFVAWLLTKRGAKN